MSTELTDSLNRILSWIKRYKPKYVDYLYPGLSKNEIDDLIGNLPIPFCPELYELYQWRNGARLGDWGKETAWLFENWTFTPLQEIVSRCQKVLSEKQLRISSPIKTVPYFRYFEKIEIFSTLHWTKSGSVFIKNNLDFCPVFFENFEEGDLSSLKKYSSLSNMMLTMAECYETGAYFIEPEGYFILRDLKKERQIWHKYNGEIIEFALQSLEPTALCGLFFIYFSNDLIEFKDPRTVDPLIQGLQRLNYQNADPDSFCRDDPFLYFDPKEEVARILGELGDARSVSVLIATLKDDFHNNWNGQTKVSAAKALGQLKDKRATLTLIDALKDKQSEVRETAAWALGEIGDNRAVEPLTELMQDPDSKVSQAAIHALDLILPF